MRAHIAWRNCPECRKSFDGIYAGHFGCRTCGRTELVGQSFGDLTGDGGLPRATTVSRGPERRGLARSPALPVLSRLERLHRYRMAVG